MNWNQPSTADEQTYSPQEIFAAGLHHHHIANTAYPINHNWTMQPYRVRRQEVEAITAGGLCRLS
jgi:hypothetical protein